MQDAMRLSTGTSLQLHLVFTSRQHLCAGTVCSTNGDTDLQRPSQHRPIRCIVNDGCEVGFLLLSGKYTWAEYPVWRSVLDGPSPGNKGAAAGKKLGIDALL